MVCPRDLHSQQKPADTAENRPKTRHASWNVNNNDLTIKSAQVYRPLVEEVRIFADTMGDIYAIFGDECNDIDDQPGSPPA
jgi:hypothetical protein